MEKTKISETAFVILIPMLSLFRKLMVSNGGNSSNMYVISCSLYVACYIGANTHIYIT